MTEYIRDQMKASIATYFDTLIKEKPIGIEPDLTNIKNSILYLIDQYLTADITKVRHGEWIDTGYFDAHKNPIYQCSICRKEVADYHINLHTYCLHCGAKMDGGKK